MSVHLYINMISEEMFYILLYSDSTQLYPTCISAFTFTSVVLNYSIV